MKPRYLPDTPLRPLHRVWEELILKWAIAELPPMHPAHSEIALRLADFEHAESPMDPADSIVTGACFLGVLFLLAMGFAGLLPGAMK